MLYNIQTMLRRLQYYYMYYIYIITFKCSFFLTWMCVKLNKIKKCFFFHKISHKGEFNENTYCIKFLCEKNFKSTTEKGIKNKNILNKYIYTYLILI